MANHDRILARENKSLPRLATSIWFSEISMPVTSAPRVVVTALAEVYISCICIHDPRPLFTQDRCVSFSGEVLAKVLLRGPVWHFGHHESMHGVPLPTIPVAVRCCFGARPVWYFRILCRSAWPDVRPKPCSRSLGQRSCWTVRNQSLSWSQGLSCSQDLAELRRLPPPLLSNEKRADQTRGPFDTGVLP